MATDIGEEKNLSDSEGDLLEAYRQELIAIVKKGRSTAGAPQENDAMDNWNQLDKLMESKGE